LGALRAKLTDAWIALKAEPIRQCRHSPLFRLPFFLFILISPASQWAHALNPSRQLSQYAHTAWRTETGDFGGTPNVITQTTDGNLWIGTNTGLLRFNGIRFVPWIPPAGQRLADSRIFSLTGDRAGGLWIGTAYNVSHWANGELTNYPRPQGRILALTEDGEGAIWIVREQITDGGGPLCRIKGPDVRCFGKSDGIPFPLATYLTADTTGNLWIGGFFGLCRWSGSCSTYFQDEKTQARGIGSIKTLAAGGDGSIWTVTEHSGPGLELKQFTKGSWTSHLYTGIAADNSDVNSLFIDRNNSLWVATAHRGIYRIQGNSVDHFDRTDDLSSDAVGGFFEDREGTIWVVTSGGVDNFRDLKVITFSMREGMYADGASSLIAAHDGSVWVGNFQALNIVRNDHVSAISEGHGLPGRNVNTLLEDHAGRLWVGIDGGLWVYEQGRFRAIVNAQGSPLGVVFTIAEDIDGSIWVRAGPNLYRIRNFAVEEQTTSNQISSAYIMAADPHGGVVLGMVSGDLICYNHGQVSMVNRNDGVHNGQIRDLLVEPDGSIWGTTQEELFRWKDGRRENMTTHNGLPCDPVYALWKESQNSFWIPAKCGFINIATSELERWWLHPESVVETKLVGPLDGVQPGLTSLKPQTARTADGRLWFVNGRVLQVMDTESAQKNLIPPPVYIEQVIADRKTYPALNSIHLPALTRDLQIDYTALSFVAPEKVLYRYRLENRDTHWQEPGIRRQAFYSDLPPGRYRFHVIACNNDGVWNETGATWRFTVEPAYYQTIWFRVLCALLSAFALWVLYRLREARMRHSMSARFDERIAERTRLAREFHDTLLQTIQASKMVADDALENAADPGYMQQALERVSGWLAQATSEGRAALNSLRTSTSEVNDLAEALERAARECSAKSSMEFSLAVDGNSQHLHPIVRDEVYRVGYEAIRNACSHSEGSRLEVELIYARNLTLRVRDNGKGIPPQVAGSGKAGHFGLKGMQERAQRVGGTLTLSSSAFSGTEVELSVPGNIVFTDRDPEESGVLSKLGKFAGARNRRPPGL
jgi:ligand-binding sensor domain-containing protein/signal transduction histidine kinase